MNKVDNNKDYVVGYNPESATRVFHFSWYKNQMTGWNKASYVYLVIGILFLLYTGLSGGVTPLGVTSTIAGIIGFTCTLSITNGRSINGLLGFVSAIMLIYVASVTGNFSDIIMQGAYVLLLDIPILFNSEWNKGTDIEPLKMKGIDYLKTFGYFVVFLAATYGLDKVILMSPRPEIDALSATIGLVGAVLTVKRFRASYYFWTAQGIMSIILWGVTAMSGHPVWVLLFTYVLYLGNDLIAFTTSKWFHHKEAK